MTEAQASESSTFTHRQFAESPAFCGLSLSPMVAAVMDAAGGLPVTTISDAESERYFGCPLAELPRKPTGTVGIEAGRRGGKTSQFLATKALHAAWTVPLPLLARNEHAVSLIVSSEMVFARQALSFCVGYVDASPILSKALVSASAECLTLRRPDGKLVDVRVRAAGAKGKGGRSMTLVFAALDEACFFFDDSGVVNDREVVRAAIAGIAPGGQLWLVSTPWVAGVGYLEELLAKNWGNHEQALAVRGIPTRMLNPNWDPDGVRERELREDPDNYQREIEAIPLTAGSQNFFSHEAIEAIFDESLPQTLEYDGSKTYGAGGDAGFRKNSSALAIVEATDGSADRGARFRLALLEERKPLPGLPLEPEAVTADFADLMAGYQTFELVVDSHERARVEEALLKRNASGINAPDKHDSYMLARAIIHSGRLKAAKNVRLRQQLRDVVSKPMPGGGVQITSPRKADGSHGDLVSALVNAIWRAHQVANEMPLPAGGKAFAIPRHDTWNDSEDFVAPSRIQTPDAPQRPRPQPPPHRSPW